jgi:hypothetical protein
VIQAIAIAAALYGSERRQAAEHIVDGREYDGPSEPASRRAAVLPVALGMDEQPGAGGPPPDAAGIDLIGPGDRAVIGRVCVEVLLDVELVVRVETLPELVLPPSAPAASAAAPSVSQRAPTAPVVAHKVSRI